MRTLCLLVVWAASPFAHVGSPAVYYDGNAGPYRLMVTVRPPAVIPGIAQIEIRSASTGVKQISIAPLRLNGEGAKYAPTPDVLIPSRDDAQYFAGGVWLMQRAPLKVQIRAEGDGGAGEMAIPVMGVALQSSKMQAGLGIGLSLLGVFLVAAAISLAGAAAREASLEPGATPSSGHMRRGRITMAVTAALLVAVTVMGNRWWTAEASKVEQSIYRAPRGEAKVNGNSLTLTSPDRKFDEVVPDHGHLMHLFLVRTPGLDAILHLHPTLRESQFEQVLPATAAGRYLVFGDVVMKNGMAETIAATTDLSVVSGKPLEGDDSSAMLPARQDSAVCGTPKGRIVWVRDGAPLKANRSMLFRFRVENADGAAAADLQPYMGMAGHAVFLKRDGSVFAHVHPSGSVPMAVVSMAQDAGADPHAGHRMQVATSEVSFPYGFPSAGDYRIFVQVKRGGVVETGAFDVKVTE